MKTFMVKKKVPVDFINEDDAVMRMSDSYDKPDTALDHDDFIAALTPFGLEGLRDLGVDVVKPAAPAPEKIVVEVPRTSEAWKYGTIGGAALFLGAAVVFWMWSQKDK